MVSGGCNRSVQHTNDRVSGVCVGSRVGAGPLFLFRARRLGLARAGVCTSFGYMLGCFLLAEVPVTIRGRADPP